MYRIIGGDGREYGPISPEQLRQWIVEGRANAQSQARPEDAAEWKPLGSLPEFADAFAAAAPPPPLATVNTQRWAGEILARDYTVKVGDWIGRGWELVKSDFWLLVGASFVAGLIAGAGAIGLVLGGPMMGGLYALYLKKSRGQTATFGDAFLGFSVAFVPLMLARIVCGLLTGLGLVLCLAPGIYLAVSWAFTLPLVIDKKMDFWAAMELSRKTVAKHWWAVFGFLIVCALVMVAGLAACCVGVFVTAAIAEAALIYAYEDIFGSRPAPVA